MNERIFTEQRDHIIRVLRFKRGLSLPDAEDVFSEAFMRAGDEVPKLWKAAHNAATDLKRRKYRTDMFLTGAEEAPDMIRQSDLRMDLTAALSTLDHRERAVTVLTMLRGYSQEEAAEELQLSQQSVSRIQREATTKLREYLR